MPQEGGYGSGPTKKFWTPYSIGGQRNQPGNPKAQGEKRVPSQSSPVSPEKAKEILRHGSVHGHALTKAQKGMFGAIAGKSRKK